MKKADFLIKLRKEGKLELVEPSDEICDSYLKKADDCYKAAKLLLDNSLWENSVTASYYTMYNGLTALLFKTGIKCENHSGAIILLRETLGQEGLSKEISFAKTERVDKQYYVDFKLTKDSARDMLDRAESFLTRIKLSIAHIRNEEIKKSRESLSSMIGDKK